MELKNNTMLITGGTSGFGLQFTRQLVELGNTVIITGRNTEKLAETKQLYPGIHTIQSDVSKPDDIIALQQQVTRQFPELNLLINNAGEMRKISLHNTAIDLEEITREIAINLSGPIRMIQQFLPHLKSQKTAAILNVTSGLALVPFPLSPIYGASKAGLRSYTQSLRIQLKKTNVKVFELIAPAAKTPLGDQFKGEQNYDERMLMDPVKLIDAAIKGLQNDELEIYPGMAKMFRVLSRLAPGFLLSQTSKAGVSFYQQA